MTPRIRRFRRLTTGAGPTILLGLVALAAIGCSSTGGAANASPVATTTVDLPKSYKFVPAAISVKTGDTVTWTNNDNFTHSVRFEGAEPLVMKPGESVTHVFDAAGTFKYDCSFHPQNMKGTVVVGG
ncbi:MAG TPA: plastocyanin/azurin family copper-binding protein [Candidatus Limnocylindrales bacterium]|nr:plastocyanin/azurin family copper-binding protein [Candidatus Limnocylindrales bacterium]